MLRTRDLATKIGVHPETIKRWIRQKKVPAPNRDRNGWFIFDEQDVKNISDYANKIHISEHKQPDFWTKSEQKNN